MGTKAHNMGSERAIQIIRDAFLKYFDPHPPYVFGEYFDGSYPFKIKFYLFYLIGTYMERFHIQGRSCWENS